MKLILENFKKFVNEGAFEDAFYKAAKKHAQDRGRSDVRLGDDRPELPLPPSDAPDPRRELAGAVKDAVLLARESGMEMEALHDAVEQGIKDGYERIEASLKESRVDAEEARDLLVSTVADAMVAAHEGGMRKALRLFARKGLYDALRLGEGNEPAAELPSPEGAVAVLKHNVERAIKTALLSGPEHDMVRDAVTAVMEKELKQSD